MHRSSITMAGANCYQNRPISSWLLDPTPGIRRGPYARRLKKLLVFPTTVPLNHLELVCGIAPAEVPPPYIRLSDDLMSRATVVVSISSPNISRCRGVLICLLALSHLTILTTNPSRDCRGGGGGLLKNGKELPNHCIVLIPRVLHVIICKPIWLCIGLCVFAIHLM